MKKVKLTQKAMERSINRFKQQTDQANEGLRLAISMQNVLKQDREWFVTECTEMRRHIEYLEKLLDDNGVEHTKRPHKKLRTQEEIEAGYERFRT